MKSNVSALALFAALGIMTDASALPMPGGCPGTSGESQTSAVISAVPEMTLGGNWQYSYRVCNTSDAYYAGDFALVDWELPWFDDAEIANVVTPIGWGWAVETVGVQNPLTGWGMQDNDGDGDIDDDDALAKWTIDGDPWKDIFDTAYGGAENNPFNDTTQVLHFYWLGIGQFEVAALVNGEEEVPFCERILSGEDCWGFGFESPYTAGDAPYQASWELLPVRTGDPLFPLGSDGGGIPNSPTVQGLTQDVPEPMSLALVAGALPLVALRRRRRR